MISKVSVALAAILCAGGALSATASAQSAASGTPSASPAPSASPSGPSDPCGSLLSIVNRPSVTTGVCTVRSGHGDVEMGYTNLVTTGPGGGNTASYPQAFVRVGIGQHVEFNVTPPSFNRSSVGGTIASGSSDMSFGSKWEIGYNDKASWGIDGFITAPSGDPGFTAGGAQYTASANGSYTLSSIFSLSGSLAVNSLTGPNSNGEFQRFASVVPSVLVSASLPAASQAFVEYAYFSHAGAGLGGKSLIDFGYERDLGSHVQLDVEYGFQPNVINGQKSHYIGAGISLMN